MGSKDQFLNCTGSKGITPVEILKTSVMKTFAGFLVCLFWAVGPIFGQAVKPTIMVVPSDGWCTKRGYEFVFDNQGKTQNVPDYRRALREDTELSMVISKINELMVDRGFPLKDLEASLKSLESQSAEDAMTMSKEGGELNESPLDKLKAVANADIWIQVGWTINSTGPRKSVSFDLKGLDAYTDKAIANASGTGSDAFATVLPILLEEAVLMHIDNFNAQLQGHFDSMFADGREVILRVKTWNTWEYDLESEDFGSGDKELSELIRDWLLKNTVERRFNTSVATENMMLFEQVRIPLFDTEGNPLDTRQWTSGLRKHLKKTYGIESKLMMKGLGQAQLVLGSK